MFARTTIAGPLALLAAPIAVIASALVSPTLSGDAATQVTALTSHRGAMITGMTLDMAGVVLLIAGLVWLAITLVPRAPRLAVAGGVAGVAGLLVVLFENSVTAAAPAIVGGLGRAQATACSTASTPASSRRSSRSRSSATSASPCSGSPSPGPELRAGPPR